jgi:hypothetical protein
MQPAKNSLGYNLAIHRNVVSARLYLLVAGTRVGNARSEAGMGPAPVVVRDPLPQKALQVSLVHGDQEVQAFAANHADHALTERVRLGSPKRCLQYPQVHGLQGRIELGRVDAPRDS